MNHSLVPFAKSRQHGAVLVVGLILLIMVTMLGLSAMQGTNLQERMSGNYRDRDLAFQAAEAALRAGEFRIAERDEGALGASAFSDGPLSYAQLTEEWGDDRSIRLDDLDEAFSPEAFRGAGAQPRLKAEVLQVVDRSLDPSSPDIIDYFRVSARGLGARDGTVVIVQSTQSRMPE